MEHFTGALQKYADFKGRAQRIEFWTFLAFYIAFFIACIIIDGALNMSFPTIFAVALFLPTISITARRLHDTSRSGWWQLIALIPVIGLIILVKFLIQESHDDNAHGPALKKAA